MTELDFVELFQKKIEERKEWTRDLFEAFHRIPELSMKEYQTTERIEKELTNLGVACRRLDPTGLAAWIGPSAGPLQDGWTKKDTDSGCGASDRPYTIALRADIDALPVKEETGLSYSSCHEGVMHACGHDGHIAGLLTAAAVLKEVEDQLKIRVKLIFQPSEENTQGALHIMKQGVLDDVDEIFGLHLFSDIPTGKISIEEGPRMAQTDRFKISLMGSGGHAAKPHLSRDATVMAAELVMSLQTIISREIDPTEGAVVTVGSLHSGSQYNVISGQADLEGTCRCYSPQISGKLEEGIRRRALASAASFGGKAQVTYTAACHPPVVNDPSFAAGLLATGKKRMRPEEFQTVGPLMLGEDFSWYQKYLPGVFAFVGCGQPGQTVYPNHHPRFCIDPEALSRACLLHLCAVETACLLQGTS